MKEKLKVLFATDFSLTSRAALQQLKQIRHFYNVNLFMLHVLPSFWKDWFASGAHQGEALQRLQAWQQELEGTINKRKLSVKHGNPADQILQAAERNNADLIVLGSKLDSGAGRYKTGTTVESVVRHAKKSVWVSKNETVSRILCGVDGSASSIKALQCAVDVSRRFSATLCMVSSLPHVAFNPLGMNEREMQKQEEKFKAAQIARIEQSLKKLKLSGVKLQKNYLQGNPANILLDLAEDFSYDLIVVGAKGHSALRHVLVGSTTDKILRYTPCSLLVVR